MHAGGFDVVPVSADLRAEPAAHLRRADEGHGEEGLADGPASHAAQGEAVNRLVSLWNRLFPPPPTLVPLRLVVAPGVSTEEHEADWRAGYLVGFAQGQLTGRQALADEIHQEFSLHPGQAPMTQDDAARIKARQVH